MPGFTVSGTGRGPTSDVRPFLSYTWEVTNLFGTAITPVSGGGGTASSSASGGSTTIYAETLSLPTFTVVKEEVVGSSLQYKYGSEIHWDDVKVTFYDTVGLCAQLQAWRNSVWTPAGGLAVESMYKKQSVLTVFTADWTVSKKWTLMGSWPSEIKDGELSYADSNFKIVSVTVTYDWAVDNCEGSGGGSVASTDTTGQAPGSAGNQPGGGGSGGGGGGDNGNDTPPAPPPNANPITGAQAAAIEAAGGGSSTGYTVDPLGQVYNSGGTPVGAFNPDGSFNLF